MAFKTMTSFVNVTLFSNQPYFQLNQKKPLRQQAVKFKPLVDEGDERYFCSGEASFFIKQK